MGENLGPMMQRLHGSVAKLTNDTLPERRGAFWQDKAHDDYYDGCIRDVLQFRKIVPLHADPECEARHCAAV